MAGAYYNEFDKFKAQWLRENIKLGLIAPGEVDDRSIKDVSPDDLEGFTQCHFFAGVGGWSYAARRAGWPDDRPLWSASCPCQPFSEAGEGLAFDDPRDLWPDYLRLQRARRPAVVVGEQVASKAGLRWLDRVVADLARTRYAGRAVDIPACAVDAPNIRQRLYWAALDDLGHAEGARRQGLPDARGLAGYSGGRSDAERADGRDGGSRALADARGERPVGRAGEPAGYDGDRHSAGWAQGANRASERHALGDLADADVALVQRFASAGQFPVHEPDARDPLRSGAGNGSFWRGAEWIVCHDGKARRTEPGVPLLASGIPGRVHMWRGFGDAINAELAAQVLGALLDVLGRDDDGLAGLAA